MREWIEQIPNWVQALALFFTFLAGVAAVARRFYRVTSRVIEAEKFLRTDVKPLMEAVKTQLLPNGGTSLPDRVKRMDERLMIMEARQRLIDANSALGEYQSDPRGACTWANRQLCEMFGLAESEMMGNGWLRAVVQEDRESVYEKWMAAVRKDIPYECRYRIRCCESGEEYEVYTSAVAIRDSSGTVMRYYGTVERAATAQPGAINAGTQPMPSGTPAVPGR